MDRWMIAGFAFAAMLFVGGCDTAGRGGANDDGWFRKNTEAFERRHADHVKQSSEAVSGYQQYRNR